MAKSSSKAFKYTALGLGILEKLLGSKFTVEGIENIPPKPVLFVANHFTRSETFVIPYIIYKHTKRQVRCLADSGLFHGVLGRFLKSLGTLSTRDERRNGTIIADLIKGSYDWMIYPEGSMIKSKEIHNEGNFISYTPGRIGPTRTGAAVLALKSELYRKNLIDAKKREKKEILAWYKNDLWVEYDKKLEDLNTYVVPVNITYYPIRPGNNPIKKFAARFFKRLPSQISEELEIEGNLLLSSNINVSFGAAINVADYIKNTWNAIYQIPIIKEETKNNLILRYLKLRLTNEFMNEVYLATKINIDHLFSAILSSYPGDKINAQHLRRLIYLSALMIKHLKKYRLDENLEKENIFKILIDKPFEAFKSIVNLAQMLGIIKKEGEDFVIDKEKLKKKYDFHDIRLENTIQVIANEFSLLKTASDVVRRNVLLGEEELKSKIFSLLKEEDLKIFEEDYKKYYDKNLSKPREIGAPFFLDSNLENKSIGILMCHGYLAAPEEVRSMAQYFNDLGFRVYGVRLKGHGTAPLNLKDISYEEWLDSVERGYAVLRVFCSKILMVGFSTGGLLMLTCAINKNSNLIGVVVINAPLKLNDLRTKIIPGINAWNHLLDKFNIKKGHLEYVENNPENININYSQNYLEGMEELEELIDYSADNLKKVKAPVLVIQSNKDHVVNPESGKIIFNNVGSLKKELIEIDSDKHVIITNQNKSDIFAKVKLFLNQVIDTVS